MSDWTGTRVPAKTAVPPRRSGEFVIKGFGKAAMESSYGDHSNIHDAWSASNVRVQRTGFRRKPDDCWSLEAAPGSPDQPVASAFEL